MEDSKPVLLDPSMIKTEVVEDDTHTVDCKEADQEISNAGVKAEDEVIPSNTNTDGLFLKLEVYDSDPETVTGKPTPITTQTQKRRTVRRKISAETFDCEVCGERFPYLSVMKDHMHFSHEVELSKFGNADKTSRKYDIKCHDERSYFRKKRDIHGIVTNVANDFYHCDGEAELASVDALKVKESLLFKDVENQVDVEQIDFEANLKQEALNADGNEKTPFEVIAARVDVENKEESRSATRSDGEPTSEYDTQVDVTSRKKTYDCEICNVKFPFLSVMREHVRLVHGDKVFECEVCKKTYSQKSSRIRHQRIIHGVSAAFENDTKTSQPKTEFLCDICGRGFQNQCKLLKHQVCVHTEGKPHRCDVCDKGFRYRSHLATHRRFHTGEKPFKCEMCNEKFTNSGSLSMHRRLHTGEKPFQCEYCNLKFRLASRLRIHRRTHTGEKPFECDICNKTFATSSARTCHRHVHTGEKPFKCEVCDRGFVQSTGLENHRRRCAGDNRFTCRICRGKFEDRLTFSAHKEWHRHNGDSG